VIDRAHVTRSNVRLFAHCRLRLPERAADIALIGPEHETHLSTFQAAPRTDAWIPCTDEDRRRSQGVVGSPRQGPRAPVGLTRAAPEPRAGHARSWQYRLRGTGAFESVFKAGARHDAQYLQLIAAPAAQAPGRVGYVIGRKQMPRAVDRNRLRRRLRESVRAARPAIESFDIIIRVKRSVPRSQIELANAQSRQLLARVARSSP
jgi:ribonuclease P protein component